MLGDHVGLGTDGALSPRRFETLALMLSKRGHKDARIEQILGGNFARAFAASWG